MTLRVAFNATPLLAPITGIGNYTIQLGAALAATGDVDPFSFYGFRWRHEAPTPPPSRRIGRSALSLREAIKPFVPFKRELRLLQQQAMFARGLRRHAIALYHEPNYIPIRYDVPVVVTLHDLSWLRYPQTHPADRIRWLERAVPRMLERAAAIVVDSEFIRNEVLETFGIDPARVHTAHLGVSASFRPRDERETRATLERFDLAHGDYVLAVATIEPRKNLGHVLAAYARLPAALRRRHPLVVAGAKGWRAESLEKELRALVERGEIRFLGYVPELDLPPLYAGAAVFLFPSLYDGFGLPPLEAMAAGVPVVASNRASLPEIAGDGAVLLDPERPDLTAAALASLLDDNHARAELSQRGLRRAAAFTWEACAHRTLGIYRAAVKMPRA